MKIAHIVSTFPPYKAGIGNTAYHLSWQLARLGHDVTVFTNSKQEKSAIDNSLPFKVVRLRPWVAYGNAGFVPQLLWLLHDFDIIHLHYPFFGGAEMVYFRNKIRQLNIILHYHMDVHGEGVMKKLFTWHSHYIMPKILDDANKIIVTSLDYAKKSLIANWLNKDEGKFSAIPLGVNPRIFKPRIKSKDLITKHNLQNNKIILFVGGLDKSHYFKGVNYLIKAFQTISSNNDYRLIIVGSGALSDSYKTIVTNFGLERKVIFTGYVSDDSLPSYYNLADVFVLPSIDSSEAFGIAILEAMASGVAVIATDLPGVREVVRRDITGYLVKAKRVDAIAKKILFLLKNPQVRNRFGDKGRERVITNYTWEIVGQKISNLYQKHQA
jgi:glycosyltransferase involved in cell wall biosynthesis